MKQGGERSEEEVPEEFYRAAYNCRFLRGFAGRCVNGGHRGAREQVDRGQRGFQCAQRHCRRRHNKHEKKPGV